MRSNNEWHGHQFPKLDKDQETKNTWKKVLPQLFIACTNYSTENSFTQLFSWFGWFYFQIKYKYYLIIKSFHQDLINAFGRYWPFVW